MTYRQGIETTEELAQWYDGKYREMGQTWETPPDECNRHLDDLGVPFNSKLTLLDIGCGGGHFLAEAEKRVRCVGLEISEAAIKFATARVKHSIIWTNTIECACPCPVGGYDFITSIGSLEHVVELRSALSNIRRMLAKTGMWYFFLPTLDWVHLDQPNERTNSPDDWSALCREYGLIESGRKIWNDSVALTGVRG